MSSTASLQLKALTNSCGANQVQDFFQIANTGAAPVTLSDISVKLWVDNTSAPNVVTQINTGGCVVNASGSCVHSVTGVTAVATKFSPACGSDPTHQANWEITIANTDHTTLGAGLTWSNLQTAVHLADFTNFSPGTGSWYSACLPGNSYANTAGVAVYVAGNLVTASTGVPPTCRASRGSQPLSGEIPPGVGPATLVGSLPPSTPITFTIGLPLTNQTNLQTFVQQLSDPKSPQYRKYLTPSSFATSYGATPSNYNSLVSFVQSSGLTVAKQYPSRAQLLVSGTAAAVEQAFFVTLNLYRHADGTTFYAPANEPSTNTTVPILYLSGLNTFTIKKKATGGGGSGPTGCFPGNAAAGSYVGNDFRNVYFPGCTSLDGTGQTIGLFEFDDYYDADIAQYEAAPGFFTSPVPSPNVTRVATPDLPPLPLVTAATPCPLSGFFIDEPSTCFSSAITPEVPFDLKEGDIGGEGEVALDIEMVLSMAPKANIRVYEGDDGLTVLDGMANETDALRPSTISSSWAWLNGIPDPNIANVFLQFAAQGQSVFFASGDNGAFITGGGLPVPLDPVIDTSLVTTVGGTELSTDPTTGAYQGETVWNDSASSCAISSCGFLGVCGCNSVSSGGLANGYTACFDTTLDRYTYQPVGTASTATLECGSASYPTLPIPTYQVNMPAYLSSAAAGAGELSTTTRMIPDVSMVADDLFTFSAGFFSGESFGTVNVPAGDYQVITPLSGCNGGTSAAAPLWAAVTALANQQQAAISEPPIGFANPTLYALAAASASSYTNFHDVTAGNNFYAGSPAPTRYAAVAGYDLATGLGTPNGKSCSPLNVLPPQSCLAGNSLSALITNANVTAFMPNGSWSETSTGVSVVAIEGSGPTVQIPTPGVVNTCGGNSNTGEVVCTANDLDVYLINGLGSTPTITSTLTSGAAATSEDFSGGSCQTCNVAVDPLHNKAYLSISTATGSGAAFQPLDLATATLGAPIAANAESATSEDVLVDGLRGFVLSPNEGGEASTAVNGDYQLLNTSTGQVFDFIDPPGVAGGSPVSAGSADACGQAGIFDSAAEDCTTGIALSTLEFTDQLFLVDLTRATFNTTTSKWSAPNQFVTIPELQPTVCSAAGTDGITIAPGSHTGVAMGEFGGSTFVTFRLPPTAGGSGTTPPGLLDYVVTTLPSTPDGLSWANGRDPHTLTSFTSPASGRPYAIIEDDAFQNGTRTYLAIVDLQAMLDPSVSVRGGASPNTVATVSTCGGPGPNPTGSVPVGVGQCTVRFIPIGPVSVGPNGGAPLPTLPP